MKKFVIVRHSEIIQKAVIDLDIDLSSLDEGELHEALSEIDADTEIDWKLKSHALAYVKVGSIPVEKDWQLIKS